MLGDLPEEDQDEAEMPTLPPSKDPTGQTTQPLVNNKRQANSKQMVSIHIGFKDTCILKSIQ